MAMILEHLHPKKELSLNQVGTALKQAGGLPPSDFKHEKVNLYHRQ
jgi:hypothetical protein